MTQRVLFLISSMRGGGSERQILMLLKHLDRGKFSPHLYLTHRTGELLHRVPDDVQIHSFDDCTQKGGIYFPGRALRQQSAHIAEVIQRENIDAVYDRTFHMTLVTAPAVAQKGIPRISTIASPPNRMLPMMESRFVWLKRRRLARAYKTANHVIAVSKQAADSAHAYYGLPDGTVDVIMNPVDIQAVQADARAPLPENLVRDDRITIVCVGRMSHEKGHADLIRALELTQANWPHRKGLNVWLIGDGPLRGELERQSRETVQQHDIHFAGILPNPAPAIEAADVLVLPSLFEGLPNVVLESMAIGTPVIATRAGGTVELQRDEPTIMWADPGSPESLCETILQLANDPQAMKRYALASTKLIQNHHDVRKTTRMIEQRLLEE